MNPSLVIKFKVLEFSYVYLYYPQARSWILTFYKNIFGALPKFSCGNPNWYSDCKISNDFCKTWEFSSIY